MQGRGIFMVMMGIALLASKGFGQWTPDAKKLTWEGDIASRLIDSCDVFLLKEIEKSVDRRSAFWSRDFSTPMAYEESIQDNRERFKHIIGLREQRNLYLKPEMLGKVAEGETYEVHAIRWLAFRHVHGEGLLVVPRTPTSAATVVIPDADQTPEQLMGLAGGLSHEFQTGRILAEQGKRVLIPTLINRDTTHRKLSNREFLYRSAYELGRHIIGYEVLKVQSAIDWLIKSGAEKITVVGWGEGGLICFYSAAADTRIDEAHVGGYFANRQNIWQEPAYRNVFGLLREFGDAEIASLIAPRKLVIFKETDAPEVLIPAGTGAKPGRLTRPTTEEIESELKRANELTQDLSWSPIIQSMPFSPKNEIEIFTLPDAARRHMRQMTELDLHNQWLLSESPYVRKDFMAAVNTTSLASFQETIEPYRKYFAEEVIGMFDYELQAPNPHIRPFAIESSTVDAYEVVLDIFEGLFAYGILCIPKNVNAGEKRPVVVCQHGLEGRPQSTIGEEKYQAYKAFAKVLAERGYITFAPQNIYIFTDRFRTLQYKANAIKKTLFSIMVPQHQQIVNWLSHLPVVDSNRIAFYGLSYGGKSAMRIPPLVKQYCLSICSADFNDWVWKNASTRSPYSYVWTGEYEIFEWDLGSTFNYAEMAALIAPRPFMVERGHFDGVAPDERVAYEYAKVRHLYNAQLKIGDQTTIEWFDGPHTINGKGTFQFLDRHLEFSPRD